MHAAPSENGRNRSSRHSTYAAITQHAATAASTGNLPPNRFCSAPLAAASIRHQKSPHKNHSGSFTVTDQSVLKPQPISIPASGLPTATTALRSNSSGCRRNETANHHSHDTA